MSHHDFTIEEKLHEESYLSKERTIEYKQGEGNPFTQSARNTANMFTEVVNTEVRHEDSMPKIKIENNQVVEVNSDAMVQTPEKQ